MAYHWAMVNPKTFYFWKSLQVEKNGLLSTSLGKQFCFYLNRLISWQGLFINSFMKKSFASSTTIFGPKLSFLQKIAPERSTKDFVFSYALKNQFLDTWVWKILIGCGHFLLSWWKISILVALKHIYYLLWDKAVNKTST